MAKHADPTLSSDKQDWQTPPEFFSILHRHWKFDIDLAARADNALLPCYFSDLEPGRDALTNSWAGVRGFCNPPYGSMAGKFVAKAAQEQHRLEYAVLLVAARLDTQWWWDYALQAEEIRFLKNRITFVGAPNNATFPNALLIFRPHFRSFPIIRWWQWRNRNQFGSWNTGLRE